MSMGNGCEMSEVKNASIVFFLNSFIIYLTHAFICVFFGGVGADTICVIRLVLICVGNTGTKGAIPGLRRIPSLVRETHKLAVQVQAGRCCLSQGWAEDGASPEGEHLTSLGRRNLEKVPTQRRLLSTHFK